MEGFSYSSLVPNAGSAIQSGLQTGAQLAAIGENQRAAEAKQIAGDLITQGMGMSADDFIKLPQLKEFAQYDPSAALELVNSIRTNDKNKFDALRKRNDEQTELTASFKAVDPAQWRGVALQIAQQRKAMGDEETAAELLGLANAPPDQQKMMIESAYAQSLSGDELFKVLQPQGSNRGVQFLPTAQGYAVGDLATGQINLPEGALMPATADPALQRTIATETAAGGAQGKLEEERDQVFIDQGVAAQSGLTDIKRAKELLKTINTGGYVAAKDKAAQWFGIQSNDEGEFKNLLGQQTLAALKTTFGGNPTEGERAILMELQGSLANSKGVNERILTRALKAYETKANRGKAVAKKKGLDWELLTGAGQQQEADQPPQPSGVKFLGFE